MSWTAEQRRGAVDAPSRSGASSCAAIRPGDGTWTPLVLANGIGASLEVLQPLVDHLDPAIEVVRFDVPGVGGSPCRAPYRLPGLARLLLARLLDRLGHQRVDLLWISWGGLAQQFALSQRDLPAAGPGRHRRRHADGARPPGGAGADGYPPPLPGPGLRRAGRCRPLRRDHPPTPPERGRSCTATPGWAPRRGYLYQLVAAGWTSLPLLPWIRQPTPLLAGDDDPVVPLANARIMRRLLPDAELHVYLGGHLGLLTEAAELAAVVDRFLGIAAASDRACDPTRPRRCVRDDRRC